MVQLDLEANETDDFVPKNGIQIVSSDRNVASQKPKRPLGLTPKAIFMQVSMTALANFSIISPGMGYSYPAITFDSLTNETSPMAITRDQASWFASVSAISIPIGSLICGYTLDAYGRKLTLCLLNVLSILSWGVMAAASTTDRDMMYIQIMIARVLMGILTGISTSPAAVYGAEVAHKDLRGRLIVITTLFTAFGMLLTYFLGYLWPDDWRLISGIGCGISVFGLIVLVAIPETPSWLASKGRVKQAEKSLRTFKGLPSKGSFINSELRLDLDSLRQQSDEGHASNAESLWTKFKRPEVYKPFFIMVVFFAFQQTSGIFVVMVYAVQFSKSSGVSIDPFLCSIFIGLTRVVATVVIGISMDILGRRKPAMTSGLLTAVCMFGIYGFTTYPIPSMSWLPVALIIAYVFTSALGLLTLPFTMNSEVYPQNIRGFAAGLTLSFAFVVSFGVIKLYPAMSLAMGNNIFILFGCISILSIFFTYTFLPETKGKTLDEIKNFFIKNPDVELRESKLLSTVPEK